LLIDEQRGRNIATARGVTVLGSLRILIEAKRRGLIDRAQPLLEAMRSAGYWIDEELLPPFFQEIGEQRSSPEQHNRIPRSGFFLRPILAICNNFTTLHKYLHSSFLFG
jgi:hypothetical protein